MKRTIILTAVLGLASLGFGGLAQADDIQIVCTGGTVCNAGGVETTTNTDPKFVVDISGKVKSKGELWIAIVEPVKSGANFTGPSNHEMWSALGLNGGQDHNFSSTKSNDGGFFVAGDTGFHVTLFNTGQTLGSKSTSKPITLPSGFYPAGTIFVAFTEGANHNVIINTPWSESLLVTGGGTKSAPEPASMLMLGLGLLGVPFLRRKK
jgi:PEP-CTERM motif